MAELERLKPALTECIGCDCLSLDRCKLANPGDRAAARGPSRRYWIGDRPLWLVVGLALEHGERRALRVGEDRDLPHPDVPADPGLAT
jgi:hypothetical protein